MGPDKLQRRLSLVKQSDQNQSGEFDHNRWLFETKGTYGYGNAIWTDDGDDDNDNIPGQPKELVTKPWRPLTRKLKVPAGVISPYRSTHTQFFFFFFPSDLINLGFSALKESN